MAVEVSGKPCGGPTDTPFDKEMVKGGGFRGRRVVQDRGWDATRGSEYSMSAKDSFEFTKVIRYKRGKNKS
jgi:hypothetical protein